MVTRKGYFGTFLNILLLVIGLVLLISGLYVAYYYITIQSFVGRIVWIIPLTIGSVGAFSIFVSLFGLCGGTFGCKILYFMFVSIIVASTIALGSWIILENNSSTEIEGAVQRAFSEYDRLEEESLWQQFHILLQCCGVDGPEDFKKAGKSIPKECHRDTRGCREALSERFTLDRYILSSVSLSAGLLVLICVVMSFCIVFGEEEYVTEYVDQVELDEYYNYDQCQNPGTVQVHNESYCPMSPYETFNCRVQPPSPGQYPQAISLTSIPPQRPSSPPVRLVVLPQGTQIQPIQPISTPPIEPVVQEPLRPIQLQIPDMGFLSSLLPSSLGGRRHRHRHRRHSHRNPVSILPLPTGNGFVVCNNNNDNSESDYSD